MRVYEVGTSELIKRSKQGHSHILLLKNDSFTEFDTRLAASNFPPFIKEHLLFARKHTLTPTRQVCVCTHMSAT